MVKTMRKLIYIISICTLLMAACSKDLTESDTSSTDEGTLKLTYALSTTRSDADDLIAQSKLKIYRADGELIRYYMPASDVPDELYLVAGSYSASLSIDAESYATTSFDKCGYYGQTNFTIEANKSSDVAVTSTITNSAVRVIYDDTIAENFEQDYITYVTASDSFDKQSAQSDELYTLSFSESGTGYFILPEGVSNLSWGFEGTHTDSQVGRLSLSGVIEKAQAATLYTLNLKYSQTAGGMVGTITVSVDDSSDDYDDSFAFSPQPTITATGFSISQPQLYTGDSYAFSISAINELQSVDLELLDSDDNVVTTYSPLVAGTEVNLSAKGVVYSVIDSKYGTLTLTSELFDSYSTGGVKSVNIVAKDVLSAKKEATAQFILPGLVESPTVDLWLNSGLLQTCITSEVAGEVTISYRKSGDSSWVEATATSVGDYIYQASFEPQWSETTSDGGDKVYHLSSGFTAGNTYEYKYSIGGVEQGSHSFTTQGVQTIANSDFESSSLSCWGLSNSTSNWWASGNNTYAESSCTQGTYSGMGGSSCAYLAGASVTLVKLAAGSIFLGQFERPSITTGQVSFGQSFAWSSRPTSLKFKYAASLGTVDADYHKYSFISEGSTDKARIFFAIVDWDSRHVVSSGTSDPTGVWDPATMSEVDKGEIIGYASLWITASTSGSMKEEELTVYYYDTKTKPSKSISIVISCATSAYGDYMNGSTSSKLYVDDFEFGY